MTEKCISVSLMLKELRGLEGQGISSEKIMSLQTSGIGAKLLNGAAEFLVCAFCDAKRCKIWWFGTKSDAAQTAKTAKTGGEKKQHVSERTLSALSSRFPRHALGFAAERMEVQVTDMKSC